MDVIVTAVSAKHKESQEVWVEITIDLVKSLRVWKTETQPGNTEGVLKRKAEGSHRKSTFLRRISFLDRSEMVTF